MFVTIYANIQDAKKPRVQDLTNQRFTLSDRLILNLKAFSHLIN